MPGGWIGSNFIRANEDYSGPTVWQSDRDAAILIEAVRHDFHDQILAQGIDACINKNGANSPTANIDWGGFKIVNAGYGSGNNDYACYGQVPISASLDSGTNILSITLKDGTSFTVDLSALAVGGSTTDFARYSNALNPFQGSASFKGTISCDYSVIMADALSGSGVYTWNVNALTSSNFQITNASGASFLFTGNSGAAHMSINGATVWTTASLPASTFTGVMTQTGGPYTVTGTWAVTGPWTFTNTNMKLPAYQWSASVGGTTWVAGPIDASTLAFTDPSGLAPLLYVKDATTVAGAYLQLGTGATRAWDRGNLQVGLTARPGAGVGQNNDAAFVVSGADKGVWVKVSGTWTLIAS